MFVEQLCFPDKARSELEKKLLLRPNERALLEKGVLKATRNSTIAPHPKLSHKGPLYPLYF